MMPTLDDYADDTDDLTDAERAAYYHTVVRGIGVRQYARQEGISEGTAGNLKRRALKKLDRLDELDADKQAAGRASATGGDASA